MEQDKLMEALAAANEELQAAIEANKELVADINIDIDARSVTSLHSSSLSVMREAIGDEDDAYA